MKFIGKLLLTIVILIVVLFGAVYAMASIPKSIDVEYTEADYKSYMEKGGFVLLKPGEDPNAALEANPGMVIIEQPADLEDLLFTNFTCEGVKEINTTITPSEITAMVNSVTRNSDIFKDVKIGFTDEGTMIATGKLGPDIDKIIEQVPAAKPYKALINTLKGKPIYWEYSLERVNSNHFDGHTKSLSVGVIPVPLAQAGQGLTQAGSTINNMIKKFEGFSCDEFSISSEGMNFVGTIPQKIQYINDLNAFEQ
jgi:hypothetical protein